MCTRYLSIKLEHYTHAVLLIEYFNDLFLKIIDHFNLKMFFSLFSYLPEIERKNDENTKPDKVAIFFNFSVIKVYCYDICDAASGVGA